MMCTLGRLSFAQCDVGAADYVPPLLLLLVSNGNNVFAAVDMFHRRSHSMHLAMRLSAWSCRALVYIRLLLMTTFLRNQFFIVPLIINIESLPPLLS